MKTSEVFENVSKIIEENQDLYGELKSIIVLHSEDDKGLSVTGVGDAVTMVGAMGTQIGKVIVELANGDSDMEKKIIERTESLIRDSVRISKLKFGGSKMDILRVLMDLLSEEGGDK